MKLASTHKELYTNGSIIKIYKGSNAISSYYTCLSYNMIPITDNTSKLFQSTKEVVLCVNEQWIIYDPLNESRNKNILSYILLTKKDDKFIVADTYFLCSNKTLKNYILKKYNIFVN